MTFFGYFWLLFLQKINDKSHAWDHLKNYPKPKVQKYNILILLAETRRG